MIRISDIKMGLDDTEADLRRKVTKAVGAENVKSITISKKSVDARRKPEIYYVYSVDVECTNEKKTAARIKNARVIEEKPYAFPHFTRKPQKTVVVVGAGPAGLMCALTLAQNGCHVTLLERGKCADERIKDVELFRETGTLNPNSNVQFGEGGAGTFSDGKLTTGIGDFRIKKVLEEFHRHGAPREILYSAKPHIGTDKLTVMVAALREDIISLGGDVRFNTRLTGIKTRCGRVCAAVAEGGDGEYEIETENIVLAIGHSARDTFLMLQNHNIAMEKKSFSVGARIEHPQEMINKSQYGSLYKKLPAADYKLSVKLPGGRGVYTFCMCPGGEVIASASEEGGVVTNGMSRFARDGKNANSALLVGVTPQDFPSSDPLAGMYFQREIEQKAFKAGGENYYAPCMSVGELLGTGTSETAVSPTYRPGVVRANFDDIFPRFVIESMREALPLIDNKLKGFAMPEAILTAPETRSSSPVRILRDKRTLQSNIAGLYPCGEGAGYAGGIMSAAVDGIKVAEAIARNE